MSPARPTLRLERTLLRDGVHTVVGMDEVGRGALAGPVAVGAVAIDASHRRAPAGVRDSKLLTPAARRALVAPITRWAAQSAVGMASAREIDRLGITAALGIAGRRALAGLGMDSVGVVLLDGAHDWLTPSAAHSQTDLFDQGDPADAGIDSDGSAGFQVGHVRTVIKGDMKLTSVAAASVLAKVARDALMVQASASHPEYAWDSNKGYAAPEHRAALLEHGPTGWHRVSWRLGLDGSGGVAAAG